MTEGDGKYYAERGQTGIDKVASGGDTERIRYNTGKATCMDEQRLPFESSHSGKWNLFVQDSISPGLSKGSPRHQVN